MLRDFIRGTLGLSDGAGLMVSTALAVAWGMAAFLWAATPEAQRDTDPTLGFALGGAIGITILVIATVTFLVFMDRPYRTRSKNRRGRS